MKMNPVGWFEIYVDDMQRAKAFYEGVFSYSLDQLPGPDIEMWAFPGDHALTGSSGALVKMTGFAAGGNSTLVYFNCEDCATEEARVEQFGGRIQRSKMSIGEYGFISLAIDTEGNIFGLHSAK
ncbi:VOC family protein [Aliiglaciecola litoralis]|uniref:VOC family protein n=1 Tax=Aliiglaciecola litoralis TaxID=582857 RepID=A0ABP3WTA6_9ALTE